MNHKSRDRALDVVHVHRTPGEAKDAAVITQLTTRLGVERRPIEHDVDMVTLTGDGHDEAIAQDSGHHTLGRHIDVPREAGGPPGLQNLAIRDHGCDASLAGPCISLGALTLLGHQPPKARFINLNALLPRHLQREVEGEAVGVMERERLLTGQDSRPIAADFSGREVKNLRPGAQSLQEGPFLLLRHRADAPRLIIEFRVLRCHGENRCLHEIADRRSLAPKNAHIANHSPHESAQHIAAPLIARDHTITDQESAGPRVVRNHAEGDIRRGR